MYCCSLCIERKSLCCMFQVILSLYFCQQWVEVSLFHPRGNRGTSLSFKGVGGTSVSSKGMGYPCFIQGLGGAPVSSKALAKTPLFGL